MTYPNSEGNSYGGQDPNYSYGSGSFGNQPYGTGPTYGAGQPYGAPGPAPDNNSVWAILVTVLSVISCNLISLVLGILAVTKSNSVNGLWAQGRPAEAAEASRQAKLLSIWGGGIMIASTLLVIVAYIIFFAAAASSYGY